MTLRTIDNSRLKDGEKLDLITVTAPIDLDTITTAGSVSYVPTSPLTATNVQSALDEVASQLGGGAGDVIQIRSFI